MKKIVVLFISICSILMFGTAIVCAADTGSTAVTTEVPDYHTITVTAERSVKVIYNGKQVENSFLVERLSQPVIQFQIDDGYTIKSVLLNGEDITSGIHDGYYTFDPVYEDKSLNIIVESSEQPSESPSGAVLTGEDCRMLMLLFIVLFISGGIVLCTLKKRKIK